MGYDVHVTRKEFWADEEGSEITLDEWLAYVRNDTEIEADTENPSLENYVFISHLDKWPIWWSEDGRIYTKNPNELVTKKLLEIANALNAQVQGDDGEVYD